MTLPLFPLSVSLSEEEGERGQEREGTPAVAQY